MSQVSVAMLVVDHLDNCQSFDAWKALAALTLDYRRILIEATDKSAPKALRDLDLELRAYGIPVAALELTQDPNFQGEPK